MKQGPNAYLTKLSAPKEKQKKGYAEQLWRQGGYVVVAERARLNTQRLIGAYLTEKVLANVWWPVKLRDGIGDHAAKSLVLWLNSTLGACLMLGSRAETEGAWVKFKKPTLHAMPVLDVRRLTDDQLHTLVQAFDNLANTSLEPLRNIRDDSTRKGIDEVLCRVLGLPDLGELR
jgi:hypothetical protein